MELGQIVYISLLIPLVMVVAGIFFRNGIPHKVNWWAGYRTSMACKNQDTWVFAHKYLAKLWIPIGIIFMLLSIGTVIFTQRGTFTYETWLWIMGAQFLAFLLVTFIPTETALRKTFDKQGNRK